MTDNKPYVCIIISHIIERCRTMARVKTKKKEKKGKELHRIILRHTALDVIKTVLGDRP